jgi:hypothetical protein
MQHLERMKLPHTISNVWSYHTPSQIRFTGPDLLIFLVSYDAISLFISNKIFLVPDSQRATKRNCIGANCLCFIVLHTLICKFPLLCTFQVYFLVCLWANIPLFLVNNILIWCTLILRHIMDIWIIPQFGKKCNMGIIHRQPFYIINC